MVYYVYKNKSHFYYVKLKQEKMFLQLRDMLMVFCLSKLNIILLKKNTFFLSAITAWSKQDFSTR